MAYPYTNYPVPVLDDTTSWICFCPPYDDDGELIKGKSRDAGAGAMYFRFR